MHCFLFYKNLKENFNKCGQGQNKYILISLFINLLEIIISNRVYYRKLIQH